MKKAINIDTYILLPIFLLILGTLFIYPLSRLFFLALQHNGERVFTNIGIVFTEASNLKALKNTIVLGLSTSALASAIGFLLSWLIVRTDLGMKRIFEVLLVLPFFIPPFITAFAWIRLLGRGGYLNTLLCSLFGLDNPPFNIYGFWGVLLVSVIYTYPYAYIIISRSIRNVDASFEEAARCSGATRWQALRDIALPVILPAVTATALIIFVTTISMFGIPMILGTPGRFIVLTTRIYGYVGSFRDPNGINIAAAMSLVLVTVAVLGLIMQNFLIRKEKYAVVTGKHQAAEASSLGILRFPVTIIVAVFTLLVVAAPISAIFVTSIMKALGLSISPENITAAHYVRVLTGMPIIVRAFRNSFLLALSAPTVLVLIAVVLHFAQRHLEMPGAGSIGTFLSTPYAIPGTVIAVMMIAAFIQPIFGVSIYNTIWILFIAYILRFAVFPIRTIGAAWKQLDPALEEVARVSGAKKYHMLRDISVPLLKGGISAGWLLAFMPCLTELTLSILLYSPRNETIGVTAYNLIQEGLVTVAGALAMIIIFVVFILQLFTRSGSRNRYLRGT